MPTVLLGIVPLTPFAHAQGVAPATDASALPAHKVEPVVLSPFEVQDDKDTGYAGLNTVSGSRLNTSLVDTPAAISIFTAQFIQDIGATNVDDLVDYAVNTSNNLLDGGSQQLAFNDPIISIRGITAGFGGGRFTNFFPSSVTQDSFNIGRAELTRGPNSVLYGVGLPAGGFNVTTKKADVNRPFYEAAFRFGSYHQARGTLDVNQPIIQGKLGLRLNAVDEDRNDWHPFAFKHDERWAAALRWDVAKNTRVDVEHERGHRHFETAPATGVLDALTPWIAAGRVLDTQVGVAFPANAGMIRNPNGNKLTYDMTTGTVWNLQNQSQGAEAGANPSVPLATGEQSRMFANFNLVPRNLYLAGPSLGNLNDYNRTSVLASHEVFKNFTLEGAYNREASSTNALNPVNTGTLEVNVDTNAFLPNGAPNPNAGRTFIDSVGRRVRSRSLNEDYRFTLSYEHDFSDRPGILRWLGSDRFAALFQGEWTHSYTSGQEAEYLIENPLSTASPDNAANQVVRRTYFDLNGPVGRMGMADLRQFPLVGITNLSTGQRVTSTYLAQSQPQIVDDWNNTLLLVWQAHLLKNHLVPTVGYRKDRLSELGAPDVRDRGPAFGPFVLGPANIPFQKTDKDFGVGITRTQGVVLHTIKSISLFYNHSSSFSLPPNNVKLFVPQFAAAGNGAPVSTVGETNDFGGKFSLLGGRLFATVTYYETQVKNQYINAGLGTWKSGTLAIWQTLDAAGILAANGLKLDNVSAGTSLPQGRAYDQTSQGWEFEFTANPTPNWTLLLNYSTNKTIRTNEALEIIGYYNANTPFWTQGTRGRLVVGGTPGQLAANAIDAADGVTTIAESLASQQQAINDQFIAPLGARALGVPINQGNLRTSYSLREGRFKGVAMGLGLRYRGQRVLAYTTSDRATRREIRSDPDWTTDANLNYRRNMSFFGRKVAMNFQLNFTNLLNERSLIYTSAYASGVYRNYSIPAPRAWFLTTAARF